MVPDGRLKDVEKRIVWGSVSFLFDTNPIERDNLTRRLNVANYIEKPYVLPKIKPSCTIKLLWIEICRISVGLLFHLNKRSVNNFSANWSSLNQLSVNFIQI